jgi:hypothetical protein
MFKDRNRKWKLDKKHKESDMLAILRKQNERDGIGKKTAFRVRGRTVTIEQVHQYFQRKRAMRDPGVHYASTPSDVSYRTPSPMPVKCPVDDSIHQMAAAKSYPSTHIGHNSLPLTSSHIRGNVAIAAAGWTEAPPPAVTNNDYIFQLRPNDMYNLLYEGPSVAHSLISPSNLLIPERLFLTIKTYMDGSFERGTWTTDQLELCTTNSPLGKELSDVHITVPSHCHTVVDLIEKGFVVEFRRTMSKTFSLLHDLIRSEHPRTLDIFFTIFVIFRRNGRPEIAEMLRKLMCQVAATICSKEHPWTHISRLIATLEEDALQEAVIESWRCITDTFEKTLGPFHPSTLDAHLDLISGPVADANIFEAESCLRRLLAQCEEVSSLSSSQTLLLIIKMAWNLLGQGRYAEVEELALDILSRIADQDLNWERTVAAKLLALSHYKRDNRSLAENNVRRALRLSMNEWGMNHSNVIEYMVLLEGWLRDWGREEEADKVKAEAEAAIGQDEVDKEPSEL